MGTREWHLKRAAHHLDVAEHLAKTPDFVDWAVVALFYAAHQQVHSALSGDPGLSKDERHPRKHVAPKGADAGGRGTNQLVAATLPSINKEYRSLYDASRRTRYDFFKLGDRVYENFKAQLERVTLCVNLLNATRPDRPTEDL